MHCHKCGSTIKNNYCSNCGFPTKIPRIDKEFFFFSLAEVLNLNRGIIYTIKELTIRPGKAIRSYIKTDRTILVKPITFLFMCSLLYTLVSHYFTFDSAIIKANVNDSDIGPKILMWVENNYGYVNLLMAILAAFWLKVIFRNRGYNFFECLVAFSYISAYVMIIYTIFGVLESILHYNIMQFAGLIGIVYPIWALGKFFEGNIFTRTLKTLFAYSLVFLSVILFSVVAGLVYAKFYME